MSTKNTLSFSRLRIESKSNDEIFSKGIFSYFRPVRDVIFVSPIPTCTGDIAKNALGFTLPHEHLFGCTEEVIHNFPHTWQWDSVVDKAVEHANKAYDSGVKTIFDPTVMGLGRSIPHSKRVAQQTELQIVVATGFYTWTEVPNYFHEHSLEHMVDLFVHDIKKGIQGTNVQAAFLKCAADEPGITEGVEMVTRAVARAHLRTGAPIMTHSHPATKNGLEQQDIFEDEGVDLNRVIIGHSGDTDNLDYLQQVADRGSFLGMDRYGLEEILPTKKRNETLLELCDRGYTDQLLMSHDCTLTLDWFEENPMDVLPNWNYTYILDEVIPSLKDQGLGDREIHMITEENPRSWIEAND